MINQGSPNYQSSTKFTNEPSTVITNTKTGKQEEVFFSEVCISKPIENILNKVIASKHNPSSRLRAKVVELYDAKTIIDMDKENQINDISVDVVDGEGMNYPVSIILKAFHYTGSSNEKIYYLEIIAIV
ncbi:MAG: hypothetical protein PHY93_18535 [Bacteriovorax sp.]|nr:hypothetical protein [Bacteriovorax sp.]